MREERDITEFAKKITDMIGTSGVNTYQTAATYLKRVAVTADSYETILATIESGNSDAIVALSEKYIATSGIYQRILTYFSTFLTNDVFVAPKKYGGKTINNKKYVDNYRRATFFADTTLNPRLNFPKIMFQMLAYGAYYGLFMEKTETEIVFKDLPAKYCRSRFKTHKNVNVLEFDLTFFEAITDVEMRNAALSEFPREFTKAFNEYKTKGINYRWFTVPIEYGVAFYYNDQYRPYFISMLPSVANLSEYRSLEKSLDKKELDRILIQKIPTDKEGNFVLSIPEAAEMHRGVVNMLKNNEGTDVITTFAEITGISLGDKSKVDRDNLEKVERSVYNEAGVSRLLFSSDSAVSVDMSIRNDMALVLDMEEQFVNWLSYQVNMRFSEPSKYYFEVNLLPISHYNRDKMLEQYLKAAQFGYSKMLVGIASGMKQSSLMDTFELENDILMMHDKMIPLQSTHTQTGDQPDQGGRPQVPTEQQSETTVASQESR